MSWGFLKLIWNENYNPFVTVSWSTLCGSTHWQGVSASTPIRCLHARLSDCLDLPWTFVTRMLLLCDACCSSLKENPTSFNTLPGTPSVSMAHRAQPAASVFCIGRGRPRQQDVLHTLLLLVEERADWDRNAQETPLHRSVYSRHLTVRD